MSVPLEVFAHLIHLSLFAMFHNNHKRQFLRRGKTSSTTLFARRLRGPAQQCIALFCHLSRTLSQLAVRIPWDRLCAADRAALDAALPPLQDALTTARAAVAMEWIGQCESTDARKLVSPDP
jgi:hypothetical protein